MIFTYQLMTFFLLQIPFTYSVKSLIKGEPNVVAFAYVPDTQCVCLATRDGDIITVETETGKVSFGSRSDQLRAQ
jgi:hypothetical protein